MSKRQFKSSASAARAAFGSASPFGSVVVPKLGAASTSLSYLNELPDLSSISEPNVIVAFKNLSKRDATTKTKALEDLLSLLREGNKEIEDGVLEAWTNIYPRTSIDSARRVRQLAHTVQGVIAKSSGKRIAKRMPDVVGAWLAGLFDNDKSVAKAASDALSQVFTTAEKKKALWKAYQDPILDFCRDVFDKETPHTLSDERSISPDEANAKYYRTIMSAIGLLATLVAELTEEDFKKNVDQYTAVLQDKKLWEKALSADVGVRRSTHKMLRSFLQSPQAKPCLDFSVFSKIYLSKGLDSDQTGSASEFLDTIVALTKAEHSVWTELWQDKKSPASRLRLLVKRGSQASALNFWSFIIELFNTIPSDALPTEVEKSHDLLKAFHSGVTKRDEPRAFISEGLQAYVQVAIILSEPLPPEDRAVLFKDSILPMITQFVIPNPENSKWNVPPNSAQKVLQVVMKNAAFSEALLQDIPDISSEIIRELKLSLPETAKEYYKSQEELGKIGQRFAMLLSAIIDADIRGTPSELPEPAIDVFREALLVLTNRDGKPYGAAIMAASVAQQSRTGITDDSSLWTILNGFLGANMAEIYVSPSYKQLAAILQSTKDSTLFAQSWTKCLHAAVKDSSTRQFPALVELLAIRKHVSEDELHQLGPQLAPLILPRVDEALKANGTWDDVLQLLSRSTIISAIFGDAILSSINQALISTELHEISSALEGLHGIWKSNPNLLKDFLATKDGRNLLPNILLLTESPEEGISKSAKTLGPVLQTLIGVTNAEDGSGSAVVDVIQDGLNTAGPSSVTIGTLIDQAQGLLKTKLVSSLADLLPSSSSWSKALEPFFSSSVNKSLAVTSPLAGAVYLLQGVGMEQTDEIGRDRDGFSTPLRMAMYVVKLFQTTQGAQDSAPAELHQLLALTLQIANDHLSISAPRNLWLVDEHELELEVSDFVSDGQRIISTWLGHQGENKLAFIETFLAKITDSTSKSYYNAVTFSKLMGEVMDLDGHQYAQTEALNQRLKGIQTAQNPLQRVSFLTGYEVPLSNSVAVTRYCNELIADLTTIQPEKLHDEGLQKTVTLNAILNGSEDVADTIAMPRLSRFISKAVAWLADESIDDDLVAEIYRLLIVLLPHVSEMYGDYWKNVLDSIKGTLQLVSELPDPNAPSLIPTLHASLRLYAVLRRMKADEACKAEDERNDDIVDAWKESDDEICTAMVSVLKVHRVVLDEQHQPLMILNEQLSREISRIPTAKLKDVEGLFPQLYAPSSAIQQAAYRVLHRYIPSQQEQVSVDAALEKKTARLPDELLSLILVTPSMAELVDASFERSIPLTLHGYLLSWLLVFDHFTNASYKVKNDYVEGMKESEHIGDFLDFAFDFLGHSKGKPIDASKFDIVSYNSSALEDSPLKDTQWLLTHLYYLSLIYLPSLSKAWWIGCKSRQKVISAESWTAKHISPHVISTAFEAVSTWSITQEQHTTSDEPPALSIRINARASELTASYPMEDEQSATIIIALPATFPLHQATVSSPIKRMAVDERKWNSWLRNAQGVIAFSNNSIIDGLLAWRRNVYGALKGQTECAICYSVVSEDGQVPRKKCRTCKNSFHGSCLFKWFKSSNGTTCPLCRTTFNYG